MRLIVVLAALVGLAVAAGKERLFKIKPRLSGQNTHSISSLISINMISISRTSMISISITYTLQDVVSRVVQSLNLV